MVYHLYMSIACQSFPLHVLCLWHSFYLYFSYDSHILCFSSYTIVLYFPIFSSCTYHILSNYMFLSCTFHILSSCTIHILHMHLYILILSYTLYFRILSVLFLYWFKTNTFISYLCFSYYVNFYLIFHISRRSIRLILLLSYHILSYVFIYVFMCFHILYFSYTFLFSLLSVLYLFISCSCTILTTRKHVIVDESLGMNCNIISKRSFCR